MYKLFELYYGILYVNNAYYILNFELNSCKRCRVVVNPTNAYCNLAALILVIS